MSDPNNWFSKPEVTEGYAFSFYPVRWTPYRKGYTGKKLGRWQKMNGYAGWENCDPPGAIHKEPRELADALARIKELEDSLDIHRARISELEGKPDE
ncbi:hypothetical protein [uncultured Pelagimonas sp.]|uniref:hypothetical protein n=1 Tax=uncultured Pelagimonas sp. TaxID=1618102 RepID=UPI002625AB45|nr:hypothetical protein [uncultured Pelagimonas sp.]